VPSLLNANREIYTDVDQFPGDNGARFSMSLHFEVFSLGCLSQNQISIDGSIRLMNGKHFARQRKKGL